VIPPPLTIGERCLAPNFELIEAVAHTGNGLVDLWEASPVRLDSNKPNTDEIIDLLFPGNPLLCCGWTRHRFDTRPRANWYKLHDLPFVVPSSMTAPWGLTQQGKVSAHALSNTGPRRFLIIEFDFDTSNFRRRSALTRKNGGRRARRERFMRGIAAASRGKGSTRFGCSQRREIAARMVLLRRRARGKSVAHFSIRRLAGRRSCQLDAFAVCTNARWIARERQTTTRLFSQPGGGEMCWWQYVLNKSRTSNKMLHELARDVRGVERKRGKPLTGTQYKTICTKWEDGSRPFLRKGHDYFVDFLAKLNCVTVPKGETLAAAFQRANRREPPAKVLPVPNQGVRLLASLCRELQEMTGEQPFMLHQSSVAKLFRTQQQTISNWIKALRTLHVLRLAEAAVPNTTAARYYFIE
jgi:hypothetical protein